MKHRCPYTDSNSETVLGIKMMIKSLWCSEDLEGGQLVVLAADSTLPARRTLPLTLRHRGILAFVLLTRSLLPEHCPDRFF
jgi:hypothetical protein